MYWHMQQTYNHYVKLISHVPFTVYPGCIMIISLLKTFTIKYELVVFGDVTFICLLLVIAVRICTVRSVPNFSFL